MTVETAKPATWVRDRIGVNTRQMYTDTAWGQFDVWFDLLQQLGVRWVRDSLPTAYHPALDPHMAQMRAAGVRAILGIPASAGQHWQEKATNADLDLALSRVRPGGPLDGFAGALEGPNEPDVHGNPDWVADTHDLMGRLLWVARSAGITVPVVGPSIVARQERAVGSAYGAEVNADHANVHPYAGDNPVQATRFPDEFQISAGVYPATRFTRWWATEFGRSSATAYQGWDEQELAALAMQDVLDVLARPEIERAFLHELVDSFNRGASDPESHFGLVDYNLQPKPRFHALKWLLAACGDGGTAGPLDYGVSDTTVPRMLLRGSDGAFRLIVWRVPAAGLGVILAKPASDVRVQRFFAADIVLGAQGGMVPAGPVAVVKVTP